MILSMSQEFAQNQLAHRQDFFAGGHISIGVYVTRLAGLGMAPLWRDLGPLNGWDERFKARAAYATGVTQWGDHSSAHRPHYAAEAFPVIETLWEFA